MKIRQGTISDIREIKHIVSNCNGLTLHTHYSYWAALYNFGNSCFVIEAEDKLIGFITGLKSTADPNSYFVWQIGVLSEHRREGYAYKLLEKSRETAKNMGCNKLVFTIEKLNKSSQRLFSDLAKSNNLPITKVGMTEIPIKDNYIECEEIYEMNI